MGSNLSSVATAPSVEPSFVQIPLRRRNGEVAAYATVDAADAPKVTPYRWYLSGNGYAVRQESIGVKKQRTVSMARVVLDLEFGDPREADHISNDKCDNRRCNVRLATHAQNSQNRARFDGTSKYRGVSLKKGRKSRPWHAYGCKDYKQQHLGFFDTEEEAAAASKAWREENLPFAAH